MKTEIKLPVGIDSFEKLRKGNYYYVDKTMLIEQVLEEKSEVTLFTRPRRFGKTLNMSMLKSFFEIDTDPSLFEGLHISKNTKLCAQYMGKYPVISISLKNVEAISYKEARAKIVKKINREARKFQFLLKSDILSDIDKDLFRELVKADMDDATLTNSLQELTELLEIHFSQKVVVLIDEYDVPLQKAYEQGYYNEMVILICDLFGNVLKTNDSLAFAVLTGCLRIAKESIFTGLNNFVVYSILDEEFDEAFGFTDEEIKRMLNTCGLSDRFDEVKEWYDGYHFGNADIYCPWDVVNYCKAHLQKSNAVPENYWMNTSGNEIIEHFIDSIHDPEMLTKKELELLANGETITQKIDEMVTYKDLYSSIDNLWSALFMTGYLTQRSQLGNGYYELAVPNREIQNIILDHILQMFTREISQNGELLRRFCTALLNADAGNVENLLVQYMDKTISVRDSASKSPHENFYHGLLIGILGYRRDWRISSNQESGNGYSDILIETRDPEHPVGIVLELKYSDSEKQLDADCRKAFQQIEDNNYTQKLKNQGYRNILKYGIAFHHKTCKVMVERD